MIAATFGRRLSLHSITYSTPRHGCHTSFLHTHCSGTLSYIFNTLKPSDKFSEVVWGARRRGYTEPDLNEDLGGEGLWWWVGNLGLDGRGMWNTGTRNTRAGRCISHVVMSFLIAPSPLLFEPRRGLDAKDHDAGAGVWDAVGDGGCADREPHPGQHGRPGQPPTIYGGAGQGNAWGVFEAGSEQSSVLPCGGFSVVD